MQAPMDRKYSVPIPDTFTLVTIATPIVPKMSPEPFRILSGSIRNKAEKIAPNIGDNEFRIEESDASICNAA